MNEIKAIPADYKKVEIVDKDAVLQSVAPFSLKGKWKNPLNPKKPNLQFFSDAQYDYYRSRNVSVKTCFDAILLKYNKIKYQCRELQIYDNRPDINYPDGDRCIIWWLNDEERKNVLADTSIKWKTYYYFNYYQKKQNNHG